TLLRASAQRFIHFPPRVPQLSCFTETPTPAHYTLSLHDALPIFREELDQLGEHRVVPEPGPESGGRQQGVAIGDGQHHGIGQLRSEEHTSELQSRENLVCRLLLEKKKKN